MRESELLLHQVTDEQGTRWEYRGAGFRLWMTEDDFLHTVAVYLKRSYPTPPTVEEHEEAVAVCRRLNFWRERFVVDAVVQFERLEPSTNQETGNDKTEALSFDDVLTQLVTHRRTSTYLVNTLLTEAQQQGHVFSQIEDHRRAFDACLEGVVARAALQERTERSNSRLLTLLHSVLHLLNSDGLDEGKHLSASWLTSRDQFCQTVERVLALPLMEREIGLYAGADATTNDNTHFS